MRPYGGPYGINGVGEGWIDLSGFLAFSFLGNGDMNNDGAFSKSEFLDLGENWFETWSTKGDSALTSEMLGRGYSNCSPFQLQGKEGNGVARVFGVQTPSVLADLEIDGQSFVNVDIRFKGNGTLLDSRESMKKSIKIDLDDGYPSRKLAGVSKLNLHNMITDAGDMNDVLAYRLFRAAKVPSPRTSFAKVHITVPDSLDDEYIGLYLVLENVDYAFAQHWYGTKKGTIFKPVAPQIFGYLGEDWDAYIRTFDPKTPLSIQEQRRIIDVCKFVSQSSDQEFSSKLSKYFDIDNLARYLAVDVYLTDLDAILGPGQNMYLYLHPKTMQISIIPWDHDHSFGQMRGSQEEREQLSIDQPWMNKNDFLERLFKVEAFQKLYRGYLKEFNETIFQPENLVAQVNELAPILRPAVAQESSENLEKFDFTVGWEVDPELDSADRIDPKPLRTFVVARNQSIAEQLAGTAEGLHPGEAKWLVGMFGYMFMSKMDVDSSATVDKVEFMNTFDNWFDRWAIADSTIISNDELFMGLNNDLSPTGPDPNRIEN